MPEVVPAPKPQADPQQDMTMHHCFAGDVRYLTRDGAVSFSETVGTTQMILTADPLGRVDRKTGRWVEAEIVAFGEQELRKITISRNGVTKEIHSTPGHRWLVRSGPGREANRVVLTDSLKTGDRLSWLLPKNHLARSTPSPIGIMAGIVFGDGTSTAYGARVNLWGLKDAQLIEHFPSSIRTAPIKTPNGVEGIEVKDLPRSFKQLPVADESVSYLYGWLAGYFAADGTVGKGGQITLTSANRDHFGFVRDLATRLGIGTFTITAKMRQGYGDEPSEVYSLGFIGSTLHPDFFLIAEHRERFESFDPAFERIGWQVVSVEETDRVEEVYCAVVDGTESFVLEDNIWTMNCPRCGSGGVVGGSDGSIECGFCKFVFKVYAQPTHPFMPQTVNGQPYQIPGQQPINNEPLPAAGTAPAPVPPVPADPGSATPGAVGGGLEQFRVDAPATTPQPVQAGLRSVQSSLLVTHSGVAVPLDSYIAHLAIRHADDPSEAIQQVRARRG